MGRWFVQIPITGRIGCEVEANDEASAKEAAWKLYDNGELDPYEDVEWEATDRVTTGNVCHAMLHEIDASPIRDATTTPGKGE